MNKYFNPKDRLKEKQNSRNKDERDLKFGIKTKEQLKQENSAFKNLIPNYLGAKALW